MKVVFAITALILASVPREGTAAGSRKIELIGGSLPDGYDPESMQVRKAASLLPVPLHAN